MKRHQVMDLFSSHLTEEVDGPWNEITDRSSSLPQTDRKGLKVKVKLDDGTETFAYFYKDKAEWIAAHGIKPSYFWHSKTHESLLNVTHWKNLKDDQV